MKHLCEENPCKITDASTVIALTVYTAPRHLWKLDCKRLARGWWPYLIPDFLHNQMPLDVVTSRFVSIQELGLCQTDAYVRATLHYSLPGHHQQEALSRLMLLGISVEEWGLSDSRIFLKPKDLHWCAVTSKQ